MGINKKIKSYISFRHRTKIWIWIIFSVLFLGMVLYKTSAYLFVMRKIVNFTQAKLTDKLLEVAKDLEPGIQKDTVMIYGYLEKKNFSKVIEKCNSLLESNKLDFDLKRDTLFLLGYAYYRTHKFDKALETANKLIEIEAAYGHYLKGIINLKRDVNIAKKEFNSALMEDKKSHTLKEKDRNRIHALLKNLNKM